MNKGLLPLPLDSGGQNPYPRPNSPEAHASGPLGIDPGSPSASALRPQVLFRFALGPAISRPHMTGVKVRSDAHV